MPEDTYYICNTSIVDGRDTLDLYVDDILIERNTSLSKTLYTDLIIGPLTIDVATGGITTSGRIYSITGTNYIDFNNPLLTSVMEMSDGTWTVKIVDYGGFHGIATSSTVNSFYCQLQNSLNAAEFGDGDFTVKMTDGTYALRTTDDVDNVVKLSDGTYAINATGQSYFTDGSYPLYIMNGSYALTDNSNWYIGYDGSVYFAGFQVDNSGNLQYTSGIYDGSVLSIDTNNRRLYASDGSTVMLDWSTAGTAAFGANSISISKNPANSTWFGLNIDDTSGASPAYGNAKLGVMNAADSTYSIGGLWFGADTPSFTNYAFMGDGSTYTLFNTPAGAYMNFRVGNANKWSILSTGNLVSGADGTGTQAIVTKGNITASNESFSSGAYALRSAGGNPCIQVDFERASGGFAGNFFEIWASDTTSAATARLGQCGLYGSFNADPAVPTAAWIYFSCTDSATAYADAPLLVLPDNSVRINGDNIKLGFGAAGIADSYILYDAAQLEFYSVLGGYDFTTAANVDLTLNFIGTTNSGQFKWMEDEDYFQFSDDVLFDGDVTVVGTVQAEQLTSTDDITMAGLLKNTMGATDRQGLVIDGETNDWTGVYTGTTNYVNELKRDYNVGTGNLTENIAGFRVALTTKHTNAYLTGTSPYMYGLNFSVYDTGKWSNEDTVSHTINSYGMQGFQLPSSTLDTISTGGLIYLTRGTSGQIVSSRKLYDTGGNNPTKALYYYGGESIITNNDTVYSGTWTINNIGHYISVTGTTQGTQTNYGLYINAVTGADTNRAIYDLSGQMWYRSGGDFLIRTDGSKCYLGQGDDVYTSYTGTYWDFYVAQATTAIRFNQGQLDTDFIVYGDNGALLTLDAGTGGITLGSGVAGYDQVLTFDGETNDGVITWMEDEDYFNFADTINTPGLTIGGDSSNIFNLVDGSNSMSWAAYGLGIYNANKYSAIFTNDGGSHTCYLSDGTYGISVSNAYIVGNCSADSFTDRTPAWEGTPEEALTQLVAISNIADSIDHSSLPEFTRRKIKEVQEDRTIKEVDGRDLGATISMLVEAVKALEARTRRE